MGAIAAGPVFGQDAKSTRTCLVFDADDRAVVVDTTHAPWSSIGMVVSQWGEAGQYQIRTGTGTLISDHVVLTAGHVVYETGVGWAEWTTFIPAKTGASDPFGTFAGVETVAPDEWVASQDDDFDLAMILLGSAVGRVAGTMHVVGQPPSFYVDQTLNLTGYPTDLIWDQLHNAQGLSLDVVGNRIRHHIDGAEGESGGPIWFTNPDTGEAELVGVYAGDVRILQGVWVVDTYGYGVAMNASLCSWVSTYVSAHDPAATSVSCAAAEDTPLESTLPICGNGLAAAAPATLLALGLVRIACRGQA